MLKHFFTNSFGILTSRVLGFARDLLTANLLGAGLWADLFFVAFKLPNLFRRLFGEGAFTQAFLPHYTNALKKGVFAAKTLLIFLSSMFILSLIIMIAAPFITKLLAWGWDSEKIALAVPLVRINFWYLILIFCVTLFAGVLQHKNRFATTAFSTALLNLSMIAALFLARDLEQNEIAVWLSFGVVIGGILQVIAHIIALYKARLHRIFIAGFKRVLSPSPLKKTHLAASGNGVSKLSFYRSFFAGVLGSSAAQLSDFITTIIASFLLTGAISYLYYANRIFQLPLALFAIALSTAIFPKISKQIKNGDLKMANELLKKGFNILFFLLLFSTIGGVILAEPIIKILFERGAFNQADTKNAAEVLQAFLLGLLPYGLYKLFSLWLYANFRQKIAAVISVASLAINVALALVLAPFFGASGLALSSSLSGLFLFICAVNFYGFKQFYLLAFNKTSLLIVFSAAVFGIILHFFKGFLDAYL